MNFECQPYGIFESLSYHQEDKVVDPIIFAATVGLKNRTNKLVSSNFMGKLRSVSVIFDTGDTYSCLSNRGGVVNIEEKTLPRKLKGIVKGLAISGFGIIEYSVRSKSERMITLRAQAYYVPGSPKDMCIIYP